MKTTAFTVGASLSPTFLLVAAVSLCGAVANAETLIPISDSRADTSLTDPLDAATTTDLALGLVSGGRSFRTYLTFDLSGATAATGDTILTLADRGANENNTSSVAQTFSLFVLPTDWDGVSQPGPVGTTVATVSRSPGSPNDTGNVSFTSAALTTALNDALGGSLHLGIMSDVEGTAARSFIWFGSIEDSGFEPTLTYTPNDTTPPVLQRPTDPEDDATGVLVSASLVATFDEPVALEDGGTITIDNLADGPDTVITLPDTRVSVAGADLIITPSSPLATSTDYAVQISNDAVKDLAPAPNFFAGISDTTTWNFQTAADGTAPGLVLPTTPADDATDVSTETNLAATFDEPITAGSGSITIRNLSTASDLVIPVVDPRVSISGTTLTVDPAVNLDPAADHAIRIDVGAVTDLTGNPFAGIADDTSWNFTTAADTTNPVLLDLSPDDEGISTASGSLVATFSERITAPAPTTVLAEDFDGGNGGFTVATTAGSDWEHGTPDSSSPGGTINSGNGAASGEGSCWGTNLGNGDSGYYAPGTVTCLRSAPIDLTVATSASLQFFHAYDLATGDTAVINLIDGTTNALIAAGIHSVGTPDSSGWVAAPAIDLTAGLGQVVRIEWCLTGTGGSSNDYLGWYVDDVTVTATTGGGVTLKNLATGTATTYGPAAPELTIDGDTLTFSPSTPLDAGDLYAVQIAADALTDLSGNPFAGILDDNTWNFTVAATLVATFDARADTNSDVPLDRTNANDLAVGTVGAGRFFRSYLSFDLSGASPATGDTTLVLSPAGGENNTSSLEQAFTLFVLDADWDGATQPWPDGTDIATLSFTPRNPNDDRGISFTSAALTTAINNALGGNLHLGIKSDAEGSDARSFLWLASREEPDFADFEPRLIYLAGATGDTFADWIAGKPGVAGQTGLNDDPDGDGIDNGVENFFGTGPGVFSEGLAVGTVDPVAGTFTFTHPQGSLASDLSAGYRWSTDLVTFHDDGATSGGTTVSFTTLPDPPVAGTPTAVTATVTGTPVRKLFVRVEVTPN